MDASSHAGALPDSCFHRTAARGGGGGGGGGTPAVKRTKFFFGARYLWTREQLGEAEARVAGGVRVDVPPPPTWMRSQVEAPLVQAELAPAGFIDSISLNMYHDGSEGIQARPWAHSHHVAYISSCCGHRCRLEYGFPHCHPCRATMTMPPASPSLSTRCASSATAASASARSSTGTPMAPFACPCPAAASPSWRRAATRPTASSTACGPWT